MEIKKTAIIIDDEPKMISLLEESLNDIFPNLSIENTFTNWKMALDGIRQISPDIIFMDISMPEKSGFDILDLLPNIESKVIFVTAHSEFAIEAFEHAATGYLLKPINDKKLADTVNRVIKSIDDRKEHLQKDARNSKIGIPDNDSIVYYDMDDIVYIETINRYTKVVTQKREIISSYGLGIYKKSLPIHRFFLVHRSFIINLNHVRLYDNRNSITMTNGKEIPISKKNKAEFLMHFKKIGK